MTYRVCTDLGITIAEHKWGGPLTCIVFLGTEIDKIAGELCLQALLHECDDRKAYE